MTDNLKNTRADHALGMSAEITRRDFLGSTLLASGAALLRGLSPAQLLGADVDDWSGYGMVGEYRASNGNPREVMLAGHKMRDGAYPIRIPTR
jgi:spermidine dehydrogenase